MSAATPKPKVGDRTLIHVKHRGSKAYDQVPREFLARFPDSGWEEVGPVEGSTIQGVNEEEPAKPAPRKRSARKATTPKPVAESTTSTTDPKGS